jgi:hypothetical protein
MITIKCICSTVLISIQQLLLDRESFNEMMSKHDPHAAGINFFLKNLEVKKRAK